jgi:two-component system, OmpR family, sensor histidine kinase KdpD
MSKSPLPRLVVKLRDLLLAFVVIAVTTLILFPLREYLSPSIVALLYLLPVLISTTLWGFWPGIISAFIAFLAYNYFFLTPYYTFMVHRSQDIVALVIFLGVAVLISQLVGRARAGQAMAVARESETTRLYELSLSLAGVNDLKEIAALIIQKTQEAIHPSNLELHIQPIYNQPSISLVMPADGRPASKPDLVLPLETVRAFLGDLSLWLDGQTLAPSEERVLRTFAAQGALALERSALEQAETRTRVLEESDRLKSSLLSSVSHEFRTPLATIKAATTSLLSDQVSWDTQARVELLSVVDEETDYLNYLVGNLLDMSRIEAGALKPDRQWNILAEIVDGVVARMHRPLRDHKLEVQVPDDLPLIQMDYIQMEQVFTNLLQNSAKYAPSGTTIRVSAARQDQDQVLVKVVNEGPPVAADHLERIFDKFYRVTAPEKVSGTGLGLSICKGIIEAHGGKIWAENQAQGFAFVFSLPLGGEEAAPPPFEAENI